MPIGLTFIGTSDYQKVIYKYKDKQYETNLFPKALEHFFKLDKLLVVATKAAAEKHSEVCDCQTQVEIISIPEGRNEKELWEVFEKIYQNIPSEADLIIDVTHSFRSLPIIALSILQYLKTLKNVNIIDIVYGAYEARDSNSNIAPVFNLTPFMNIIDWSYSINDFVHHGNAAFLKNILDRIHKRTYSDKTGWQSRNLAGLGRALSHLSDSLSITRIKESLEYAKKLKLKIADVKEDITHQPEAKPLEPLLENIVSRFEEISIEPSDLFKDNGFYAQIKMIEYYLRNHQYMQAITLSREIIISKLCVLLKKDPIKQREIIENILNEKNDSHRNDEFINYNFEINEFRKVWARVKEIRNDINHAGMRKSVARTSKAITSITENCNETIKIIKKYEKI